MPKVVLAQNALLTMLGRRGRPQVVQALVAGQGPWSLRGLARAADVPHPVAGRAVRELEALGIVEVVRPGRDARISWRAASSGARFLAQLDPPDLHREAARLFAARLPGQRLIRWTRPQDAGGPLAPVRIAVVHREGEDPAEVLERVEPGLDAVATAALPRVEVTPVGRVALAADDAISRAIASGELLTT